MYGLLMAIPSSCISSAFCFFALDEDTLHWSCVSFKNFSEVFLV